MSAPIPLRQDFDASQLRGLAKKTKDGPEARRLLALAAILMTVQCAPRRRRSAGLGLQIIRDWVIWFNAHGPDGLRNRKSPGQPSKLNDAQRLATDPSLIREPDFYRVFVHAFAGYYCSVFDAITGEVRDSKIFVAVLGASNYTYAEARFSERLPDSGSGLTSTPWRSSAGCRRRSSATTSRPGSRPPADTSRA